MGNHFGDFEKTNDIRKYICLLYMDSMIKMGLFSPNGEFLDFQKFPAIRYEQKLYAMKILMLETFVVLVHILTKE